MAVNGDYIETLPQDKKSDEYEKQKPIIDNVFGVNESLGSKMIRELSHSILIAVLFIIFTLPQVDGLILKSVPNSNNMIVMYSIKCFFIIILYYIFRNVRVIKQD